MRELVDDKNRLVRKFATKNDQKDEFFHSNTYGTAQNSGNIGTASAGLTMDERKAIEEQRKFVKKYNNSKIFESTFALRHAKKFVPRTEGGENALFNANSHNRSNQEGDANGNVRIQYGRTAGSGDADAIGIGAANSGLAPGGAGGHTPYKTGSGGYSPYKTGGGAAPSRPSPAAGFSASIKPTFK